MIICPDRKYVFIRPQRVGTTSLVAGLKEHFTANTIMSDTVLKHHINFDRLNGFCCDHAFGRVILKVFPEDLKPEEFKWFTIIRNPWARIKSMHKFLLKNNSVSSFEDYLISANPLEAHRWWEGLPFKVSLFKYPAYLEIAQFLELNLKIGTYSVTEATDYREAYTEQWMIDMVAYRCAPEIKLGGYTFDEGEDLAWKKGIKPSQFMSATDMSKLKKRSSKQ